MISLEKVRELVERHWSDRFDIVPTAYSEQSFDVDRLPAWAELWITSANDRPHRGGDSERLDVTITAHLFVRDVDAGRLGERLIDSAKNALHPIDLMDPSMRVSIRELAIRDLSRRQAEADGRASRHVVVLARGIAEEICAPS